LLCQAPLTREPGDQGRDRVDIDAELDGSLVHGGDIGARFVIRRCGVQITGVGEIPPGINAVRVLRYLHSGEVDIGDAASPRVDTSRERVSGEPPWISEGVAPDKVRLRPLQRARHDLRQDPRRGLGALAVASESECLLRVRVYPCGRIVDGDPDGFGIARRSRRAGRYRPE